MSTGKAGLAVAEQTLAEAARRKERVGDIAGTCWAAGRTVELAACWAAGQTVELAALAEPVVAVVLMTKAAATVSSAAAAAAAAAKLGVDCRRMVEVEGPSVETYC